MFLKLSRSMVMSHLHLSFPGIHWLLETWVAVCWYYCLSSGSSIWYANEKIWLGASGNWLHKIKYLPFLYKEQDQHINQNLKLNMLLIVIRQYLLLYNPIIRMLNIFKSLTWCTATLTQKIIVLLPEWMK